MNDLALPRNDRTFALRMVAALAQAGLLYILLDPTLSNAMRLAQNPPLYKALFLAAIFVPTAFMVGLGQMRLRHALIWAGVVGILCAGFGWHDAARLPSDAAAGTGLPTPSGHVFLAFTLFVFIAQALVADIAGASSLHPPYPRHFDTAWKQTVQFALLVFFVGVFWLILWLGSQLFGLIGLGFFRRLTDKEWFYLPATTLAVAGSLHLTDVQPALVAGARHLLLTLLSWLLPVLVIIIAAFLVSLPFTSLERLWQRDFAVFSLFAAGVALIILINASYQDGGENRARSTVKRWATMIGAIELVPITALAASIVASRVNAEGWSVDTIISASALLIVGIYALGYLAATGSRPWMRWIETTNYAAAWAVLLVIAAELSPIADPARLMVASQIARLRSGTVSPQAFDFAELKRNGARWGEAALSDLAADGSDPARARQAKLALDDTGGGLSATAPTATQAERKARFDVVPSGQVLTDELFAAMERDDAASIKSCLTRMPGRCAVRVFPGREPGRLAALLVLGWQSVLYEAGTDGAWHRTGTLVTRGTACSIGPADLVAAEPSLQPSVQQDVVIGQRRFQVEPSEAGCHPRK